MFLLYNLGILLYNLLVAIVSPWNTKAKQWRDGRKNLFKRMAESISAGDRVVWIHVASLGEFEQGRPIIEKIRKEQPQYKILVTFYSPSGYEIRKNYSGADYIFYLPIDTLYNAKKFLDITHPEVAIIVKYEFWLNLLGFIRKYCESNYYYDEIFAVIEGKKSISFVIEKNSHPVIISKTTADEKEISLISSILKEKFGDRYIDRTKGGRK